MSNIDSTKIVILASGTGSNMQKIVEDIKNAQITISISAVISDRPAFVLERAAKNNIPHYLFDKKANSYKDEHFYDIDELCQNIKPDIIVLAGFLGIFPQWFTKLWVRKIINIHPSLLPKFGGKGMYGMNVHRAVIDAKETESGCTVHWVIHEIDKGDKISQAIVPVLEGDSPENLQRRVLAAEHELYSKTIINLAEIIQKNRKGI